MSLRERLGRPLMLVVGALLAVWLAVWAMGYTLSPRLMVSLGCAALAMVWLAGLVEEALPQPQWPDPSPASPQRWFGLDPDVRRLAHQVSDALDEPAGAERLRGQLRDELARRLVARHGADATQPLAGAPELLSPQLWQALAPGQRRPLNRSTLNQILRRIEEL